jgi:hypothetical protein
MEYMTMSTTTTTTKYQAVSPTRNWKSPLCDDHSVAASFLHPSTTFGFVQVVTTTTTTELDGTADETVERVTTVTTIMRPPTMVKVKLSDLEALLADHKRLAPYNTLVRQPLRIAASYARKNADPR